ncbi:MAG TPA: DUF2183 domain-containing protein [Candidatus Ozemobacteraceae bacterium]|nr:DUF2183 domain-containing protein [Candidatus Ozemobacteraceae bacterium]
MRIRIWALRLICVWLLWGLSTALTWAAVPKVLYKSFFPISESQWIIQGKMIYLEDDDAKEELKDRAFGNFFSHRCKQFPLTIALGSDTWRTKTDDGGNFRLEAVATYAITASGTREFVFTSDTRSGWKETFSHDGTASAAFLIISDVDDTVLVTEVTNRFKMLMKTFFTDPDRRGVVAGTPQVYQSLVHGTEPDKQGLLVFVSASPMYLAPRLEAFFLHQKFPPFTLILREFGVKEKWEDKAEDLSDYKFTKISDLLNRTASMPVILLGDSGERDPEIYARIVDAFPGRARCVIIRNITEQDEFHQRYLELKKKVKLIVWRDPQKLLAGLITEGLVRAP